MTTTNAAKLHTAKTNHDALAFSNAAQNSNTQTHTVREIARSARSRDTHTANRIIDGANDPLFGNTRTILNRRH